jgi:hypothetical protein
LIYWKGKNKDSDKGEKIMRTNKPKHHDREIFHGGSTRIPPGMFCVDIFTDFQRKAPNAVYQGTDPSNGRHIWLENVTDPRSGQTATFAWSCDSRGRKGDAYLIEPDARNHPFNIGEVHLYKDGRVCIDVAGVDRDIREVRALGCWWWTLFVNYLATGQPIPARR